MFGIQVRFLRSVRQNGATNAANRNKRPDGCHPRLLRPRAKDEKLSERRERRTIIKESTRFFGRAPGAIRPCPVHDPTTFIIPIPRFVPRSVTVTVLYILLNANHRNIVIVEIRTRSLYAVARLPNASITTGASAKAVFDYRITPVKKSVSA